MEKTATGQVRRCTAKREKRDSDAASSLDREPLTRDAGSDHGRIALDDRSCRSQAIDRRGDDPARISGSFSDRIEPPDVRTHARLPIAIDSYGAAAADFGTDKIGVP